MPFPRFVVASALLCAIFVPSASERLGAGGTQASSGAPAQTPEPPPPPPSCPVTRRPEKPFVPPAPYPATPGERSFWLGSERLWTIVIDEGTWGWVRRGTRGIQLTQKLFWFRQGYDYRTRQERALRVTGRRLDGPAPPADIGPPTNGYTDVWFMVVGIYLPEPGCWEITGDYEGNKVTYVVWVFPVKD